MNQNKSNEQYDKIIADCKKEFVEKNKKYGNSLDLYSAHDVLEKLFIKLYRIQNIQEAGESKVEGESIERNFLEIINYGLYGIITALQISSNERILFEGDPLFAKYDEAADICRKTFQDKNHDYGEAWRSLSISFMTTESLVKHARMKQMYKELKFQKEKKDELQKEFVEVFRDIVNYAVFCSILIPEGVNPMI